MRFASDLSVLVFCSPVNVMGKLPVMRNGTCVKGEGFLVLCMHVKVVVGVDDGGCSTRFQQIEINLHAVLNSHCISCKRAIHSWHLILGLG